MKIRPDWNMFRIFYLEDGTEQSFVTVADGEDGCRRNLNILRGDNARFMHADKWREEIWNDGETIEPATAPETGARVPGEEEECFEQTVLWD